MCLHLEALLDLSAIAFASSFSQKISTCIPVSSGSRNTKLTLMKSASFDAWHLATYSASQEAVVTQFRIDLSQLIAMFPNITEISDTDLRSLHVGG